MNPILYSLLSYGLTAVISYIVIAIIVVVNAVMSRPSKKSSGNAGKGA